MFCLSTWKKSFIIYVLLLENMYKYSKLCKGQWYFKRITDFFCFSILSFFLAIYPAELCSWLGLQSSFALSRVYSMVLIYIYVQSDNHCTFTFLFPAEMSHCWNWKIEKQRREGLILSLFLFIPNYSLEFHFLVKSSLLKLDF